MKKITLTANGQRHEFTGQLIGSTRDERNVNHGGCINREVSHHALYQLPNQSFLLYADKRLVGPGTYERKLRPLEAIHVLYDLLPEHSADHLIEQFLSQVARV